MKNYLNFETKIKDLENELEKLKDPYNQEGLTEVDTQKISSTQTEIDEKLKNIYSNLDPWQTTMVARHEDRPKAKFFIDNLFDEAIAIAPPEPPSPIIIAIVGTLSSIQHSIDFAIASACPRSSAPTPGYAPGVSIKEIIGILNLFAKFINLIVFL